MSQQDSKSDVPTLYQPYKADETYLNQRVGTDKEGKPVLIFFNMLDECRQEYHERGGMTCLKEQTFTNSDGELEKTRRWYPDGKKALKKTYTTENGQRICIEEASNMYGFQSWKKRYIVMDGKEILDGPQKHYGQYGMGEDNSYYVAGKKQGVETIENVLGRKKSYYWQDKEVSQPIWWLKQNTHDLGLGDLTRLATWKKLAKALVSENKNPEPAVKPVTPKQSQPSLVLGK